MDWVTYFAAASDAAGYKGHGWKARLARDAGTSDSNISKWAAGTWTPDVSSCKRLAEAWGVPFRDVLAVAFDIDPGELGLQGPPSAPLTPSQRRLHAILADPTTTDDVRARVENLLEAMADWAEAAKPGERQTAG